MKLFILKKISIKSYSKICYKPYNLTQIIIYASQYVFTQENMVYNTTNQKYVIASKLASKNQPSIWI